MVNILYDIGLIMIAATIMGTIARLLKQPLLPFYIIGGIILGPVLGLITDEATISTLAEIGIAFLLFIVGMELDLRRLKEIGLVATLGGTLQIFLLFSLGFLAGIFLLFDLLTAVYIGIIMAFSSTMVVIKILGDRNELDTLHGRIIIGFLLMQDLFAIIALSLLGGTGSLTIKFLVGALLLFFALFLGKFLLPKLFSWVARSQELLFLFAVSTCLSFALLFMMAGFSIVVGAFIAGIVLGNLSYHTEIVSKVKSLKEFFGVIFFVAIGLSLDFSARFEDMLFPLIVLLLFTIIVLPIITITICALFGYKRRTAFLTGISLAQLSEFSLIIIMQGKELGHISDTIFNMTIFLTIITFALTSYFLKFEEKIYRKLQKGLRVFENISKINKQLENVSDTHQHDVVLIGYDRTGYSIFRTLRRLKKDFVVVDYNPDLIKRLMSKNIPCIYGDASDIEILEKLKLHNVKLVISTIAGHNASLLVIKKIKEKNKNAAIIVTSNNAEEALELYDNGADYVIIPHYLGGDHVSLMLENITDNIDLLLDTKIAHIKDLHTRKKYHPRGQKKY